MTINRLQKNQRMSQAVVHGDVVYLAGQVAEGSNVAEQTRGILAKIDALLADAGSSKAQLLSATIWLTDMSTFNEMNELWDAWVDGDNPPARACVGTSALATLDYRVEIMVTAAVG